MLAYESTPEALTTEASTRAVPFGAGAPRYDISIDALTDRKRHVEKLVEKANALLATAHEAFVAGASCASDCAGVQALHSWVGRLVTEDERLEIEIRRFHATKGAKKK
jgi:hypothetical protein